MGDGIGGALGGLKDCGQSETVASAGPGLGNLMPGKRRDLGEVNSPQLRITHRVEDRFLLNATAAVKTVASDARLKSGIFQLGMSAMGIPIYKFRYLGDPSNSVFKGAIAQDVLSVAPNAVHVDKMGFYSVDYGMIDVPFGSYPADVVEDALCNAGVGSWITGSLF